MELCVIILKPSRRNHINVKLENGTENKQISSNEYYY